MEKIKRIQRALQKHGFYLDGKVDGIWGPKTERAIVEFKQSQGLRARPYIGPITRSRLFGHAAPQAVDDVGVPWLNEIGKYLNMHESDPRLAAWLKSDGGTVGDPDDIPWCGDAAHTAFRNTLPGEPFTGDLKKNPYLAKNWEVFGVHAGTKPEDLRLGAVLSLWRKKPTSIYGHVAFAIGYDPVNNNIRMRGGNQQDRVQDDWISFDRLRKKGIRLPKTFKDLPPIPIMDSTGAVLSTNEA